MRIKPPSAATAISLVALFVALGGTGYAVVSRSGVPDHAGVFHGCVDRRTGALRVVTSAHSCRAARGKGRHRSLGEFAVSWSQTGPPGVAGRNGANGTNGTDGTNGTAIAYASVSSTGTIDVPNTKGIRAGSVTTTHPGIYCFTDVSFVPHVVNVTPQHVSNAAVGGTVLTPPVNALVWSFDCGASPKSANSFIVEMLQAPGMPVPSDFGLTVN